jgi:hypothetical protein
MTHKEWLKNFKHCRSKFTLGTIRRGTKVEARLKHGNLFCGLLPAPGTRCMFRVCPLVKSGMSRSAGSRTC